MAKAEEIQGIDCQASVLDGARLVLRARLDEMCALRAHALNWDDIEGVHDMRVASRRLRSALSDFTPYLHKRVPQKRLKAIARALGAVRDEDVAIEALEKLRDEAAEELRAGIEQIIEERRVRRQRTRVMLEETITEAALFTLQGQFLDRLARATTTGAESEAENDDATTDISFRQAGRETVLARFKDLEKLSRSLYTPFETVPLHRMRIAAKSLRYAIELFAQCWGEQPENFAREIAELQKSLGELHDCDVWIEDFGARLVRHQKKRAKDSDKSMDAYSEKHHATVWLLRHFVKDRTRHFRDALAQWHEWETTDFLSRLLASIDAAETATEYPPTTALPEPATALSEPTTILSEPTTAASEPLSVSDPVSVSEPVIVSKPVGVSEPLSLSSDLQTAPPDAPEPDTHEPENALT